MSTRLECLLHTDTFMKNYKDQIDNTLRPYLLYHYIEVFHLFTTFIAAVYTDLELEHVSVLKAHLLVNGVSYLD